MKLLYALEKRLEGTKRWFVIHERYYTNKKDVIWQLKKRKTHGQKYRIRIYKLLDRVIK
jgi:hypothetical protein